MEAWLKSQGLWCIVSGSQKRPELKPPSASNNNPPSNSTTTSATAAAQTELREAKPLSHRTFSMRYVDHSGVDLLKSDDESFQSLINRVDKSMKLCQSLRPKDFDLKALDKELTSMVLIHALPDQYSHFVSFLLLMDKLDKDTV
ncbi:hypothetical protein H1R20_g10903, partial [Candolleomyces eurysporus]